MSYPVTASPVPKTAVPAGKATAAPSKAPAAAQEDSGFSFFDLLDIVNPLQHIPIVSSIYREITGDKISNTSRIIGGALFGGVIGAAIGGINAVAVRATGEDVGELAMEKAGITKPKTETAKADENLPVVEVHPLAQNSLKDNGIIWDDAPKQVAAAKTKEQVSAPAAQKVASTASKDTEIAAALPSAKDLNDLEPGNAAAASSPATTAPVTAETLPKEDVPKNMLQALAKYQSMQRLGEAQPSMAPLQTAQNNAGFKPYAGLGKIRRVN